MIRTLSALLGATLATPAERLMIEIILGPGGQTLAVDDPGLMVYTSIDTVLESPFIDN